MENLAPSCYLSYTALDCSQRYSLWDSHVFVSNGC